MAIERAEECDRFRVSGSAVMRVANAIDLLLRPEKWFLLLLELA